jgi:hypothetical protein
MEEQGFINTTPFAAEQLFLMDERGRDILVLVIKATYQINATSELQISEEQVPVNFSGEYYGEPGKSSFKYEPEVAPLKPATDVALIGHAYPDRRGATCVDVTLKVAPLQKTVRVFGDRYWTKNMGFKTITSPRPFDRIPLVYERAFGGWDRTNPDPQKHVVELRNPVGTGYRHKKYGHFKKGAKLPNLENPKHPIKSSKDTPPPACFGFIGPEWEPRRKYIGTYDDKWMKTKMPLLPDDFDRRYYNAAHPDLIAQGYLKGNEPVEIVNASPKGRLRFNLPGVAPPGGKLVMKDGTVHEIHTNLDTVIINTDKDNVLLLWRGNLDIYGKLHDIYSVKVQMAEEATN